LPDDTSHSVVLTAEDGDALGDGPRTSERSLASRLVVSDDQDAGIYEATLDGTAAAGVVYARTGGRVTLLATSVFPQFRGQGIAAALLTRVLDGIRHRGDTITVTCPFTARFLASHPEYADLIDPHLPGVPRHQH
jgi:predicted GNAT family acetyltransferase